MSWSSGAAVGAAAGAGDTGRDLGWPAAAAAAAVLLLLLVVLVAVVCRSDSRTFRTAMWGLSSLVWMMMG
jgi:hypothetical protein